MAIKFKKARQKFKSYTDADKAMDTDGDGIRSDELDEKKKLSPKELANRLRMIAKAVEKQNKKNADRAKKDAMKMMKDTGMFDEGLGDASLAINPKTVKQSKPLLMKHAKKFGIDLEFGMGGRLPSVLQMKGSSGAVKNFLASIQKDRRLMGLIDD